MAALPGYVVVAFTNYGESFDPSVERAEMERGPATQATINSQVAMQVRATFQFESRADADAFEDWYFDTIKRVGYFTMTHPRKGTTINARFPGGDIGELVPLTETISKRDLIVEYMR